MTLTRRSFLAATAAAPLARGAAKKLNFVFIFSDDHHYQALGAAGNPHIKTPNLDRLAARGVNFTNAQISTTQCAPSRGILLSGLETYQNGLLSNGQTKFKDGLGPTVIEQLRRGGYDTVLVGKWHIQNQPRECGFARAPLWLRAGGSKYQDPQLCSGLDGQPRETPGHITDLFTDAAISAMREAKEKPFFLWLAYNAPHTPWYAEAKYTDVYAGKPPESIAPPEHPKGGKKFDWNLYYAVITHLDEAVGRLISDLEQRGLWENTCVFFVGDNGYMSGTRNITGKVVPWEESVRVPFLAAGAGTAKGKKSDAPIASIDLCPTWLELAGVKPAYALSGRSLTGVLKTGSGGPEAGFSVWPDGRREALAVRTAVEPYRLVRTRTHKLIVWESGKQSLFDIRKDQAEQHDLIADASAAPVRDKLRGLLRERMKATGDPALAWLQST